MEGTARTRMGYLGIPRCRQREVSKQHVVIYIDEDVLGFDVAVDVSLEVGVMHRAEELLEQPSGFLFLIPMRSLTVGCPTHFPLPSEDTKFRGFGGV